MGKFKCEQALLIDNNATDNYAHKLAIIESQLARKVKVVTSGKHALDYLKDESEVKPQLILFDVHIPIIEGQVFLHEYAGLTHLNKSEIKIVILSQQEKSSYLDKLLINEEIQSIESKPLTMDSMERMRALVSGSVG